MDLNELERLAMAATPGPWKAQDEGNHRGTINIEENGRFIETIATAYCGAVDGHGAANARYIAALSPDVTLALVARVRELEAEVSDLRASMSVAIQEQRAAAAAEARERALKEAAAAVCEGCKAGYPTRWYPSGNWHEIKVVGADYADRFHCRADAIRALMKGGGR